MAMTEVGIPRERGLLVLTYGMVAGALTGFVACSADPRLMPGAPPAEASAATGWVATLTSTGAMACAVVSALMAMVVLVGGAALCLGRGWGRSPSRVGIWVLLGMCAYAWTVELVAGLRYDMMPEFSARLVPVSGVIALIAAAGVWLLRRL